MERNERLSPNGRHDHDHDVDDHSGPHLSLLSYVVTHEAGNEMSVRVWDDRQHASSPLLTPATTPMNQADGDLPQDSHIT